MEHVKIFSDALKIFQEHMSDLEQIAVMSDRHMRLLETKKLLERLPRANHAVLKFLFQHFVR